MFTGEKIILRELRREDIILAQNYINDPETRRLLSPTIPFPFTEKDEENWFEGISAFGDKYSFAIVDLDINEYIGSCGVNNIDWKNSIATIGILIGKKEYWGKGYGTDAMKVLISFIFNQMNINKIKLNVFSFNDRAIKSYEKCGFKIEGRLRQELYRDGKYHDNIIMGLLREEFTE